MLKFGRAIVVALLLGGVVFAGTPATAEANDPQVPLRVLNSWWHGGRTDHQASGTASGDNDAVNAGYAFVRSEGYVLTAQVGPVVPLYLYWHAGRLDNYTTAAGANDAVAAGYALARIEGYVYPTQVQGTVPLYTYWHSGRLDHYTASSSASVNEAIAAGYTFLRVEGYVLPS